MTFHEKLARLLDDRNKSAVARRAGMPSTAIHNLLCKHQTPRADRVLPIARALAVSVEWLIDDAQDWPPVWSNPPVAAEHSSRKRAKVA